MWSIRQTEAGWEVVHDGQVVGEAHATYDLALAVIAEEVRSFLAAADNGDGSSNMDGLLPEVWEDAGGIAFSEPIPDGRDFTNCQWSWRDPDVSTLPLMLQTETEIGHFGAELAGFIESLSLASGTVHSSGRFYATDMGRQARDLLLSRQFGVSVDPGRVEVEWICNEEDEDGWCVDEQMIFNAYEIIGVTMTPFPGFPAAAIQLQGGGASGDGGGDTTQAAERDETAELGAPAALAAAASATIEVPLRPNRSWFEIPEVQPGMSGMLDVYGMPAEELLIEQRDGGLAVPLMILDDGRVYGNLARWGQQHVGYRFERVTPPDSGAAYAHYHVGSIVTDDGRRMATGMAVYGCEHAPFTNPDGSYTTAAQARDYYAHSGAAWAQLRVSSGVHGPWVSGALMPGLSELQLRILRALVLSGDWRDLGSGLELIGVLAVNQPGFPIAREALAASGLGDVLPVARTRGLTVGSEPRALVAAGTVSRCARCQERAALAASGGLPARPPVATDDERLGRIEATLQTLERRTRHLVSVERDHIAQRIRRPA